MDKIKSLELEKTLSGREVGGFRIEKYVNHGKSAAVFRGHDHTGAPVAVKIFDDELIERYGDRTQLQRIERELSLIRHGHSNLVKIHAGGVDTITGNHFIVMEYLDGPNLKACLREVPHEAIPKLIEQLASAARYLEERNLVHRDIKPENIILLNGYRDLVLLDLGVLRPIGQPGLTDPDGIRAFVGTLQYSSPEFLLREENDNLEGWRALTFYQIGGVLHDLLMRRPLFEEFVDPYARLVMAIQNEIPVIQSSTAPTYLVDLANRCLLKDPGLRTRFVDWNNFAAPDTAPPVSAKDELTKRVALSRATRVESADDVSLMGKGELVRTIIDYLKVAARAIRSGGLVLPPITTTLYPAAGSGLCIDFAASGLHQLPRGLRVYIVVEVLESAAKVIVIRGCACTHLNKPTQDNMCHIVFEGIYEGASVYQRFEEFIYQAFLWAENNPGANSADKFWPGLSEA